MRVAKCKVPVVPVATRLALLRADYRTLPFVIYTVIPLMKTARKTAVYIVQFTAMNRGEASPLRKRDAVSSARLRPAHFLQNPMARAARARLLHFCYAFPSMLDTGYLFSVVSFCFDLLFFKTASITPIPSSQPLISFKAISYISAVS